MRARPWPGRRAQPPPPLHEAAALVAARERAVPDLRPDTEARLTFAHADRRRTACSLVYLPGFGATRQETAPFSEDLAERLGANLFEARLPGQGRTVAAMGEATAEDWVEGAREAIALGNVLGERPIVVGCSTGATLALAVAARDRPPIAAMVLLAPNLGLASRAAPLLSWPGARLWVPLLIGRESGFEPETPAHEQYWTFRYPVSALFELATAMRWATDATLERLRTPVLGWYSPDDDVVDPRKMRRAFSRLPDGPPTQILERVSGPGHRHVVAGRILSPHRTDALVDRTLSFLTAAGIAAG